MTAPDKSSMVERSTTVRFLRWLFSWRGARCILISLTWLVTLAALFHAEENWRGRRAWDRYRRGLEAQGARLDYKAFIPKPVPDEQNFAATPVIKSWFAKEGTAETTQEWDDDYSRVGPRVHPPWRKDAPASRHFEDLVGWAAGFDAVRSGKLTGQEDFYSGKLDLESRAQAVPAVLEGLKTNEALFAELRLASQRPYSRYPVNYDRENVWEIKLPHLAMIKGICQRLGLKACAELAGGRSEQALEDVRLMLRLADSVKGDACLISYLIRLACTQLAVQPIWEGLAEHRWSAAQLEELEARLQQDEFIADLKPAFEEERAAGLSTIELLRRKGPWYLNWIGASDWTTPEQSRLGRFIGAVLVPRGWYSQEELNYCRDFQTELATGLDTTSNRVSPTRVKADTRAFERTMAVSGFAGTELGIVLRHQVMARLLLPALSNVILKAAAAQTAVNQTAIACALERYRLATGQLPEKLEALAPQFISPLPNDVLTGKAYKYRRTDNGRFVLYSVGWDEKDDGGVPGKTMFNDKQGDWVWEYPSN
jgi:hypothetical protein